MKNFIHLQNVKYKMWMSKPSSRSQNLILRSIIVFLLVFFLAFLKISQTDRGLSCGAKKKAL